MSETADLNEAKNQLKPRLTVVPIPRRRRQLETAVDVRREMARVYREMRRGKIESQVGTRLTYVLSQIGKIIETAEIEVRIAALERATGARRA
jgi:hypothetical protein